MTLAKAFVTGVITKAPEKRFTQNDMPVVGFSLDIDQANQTLVRVVAYGQLADKAASTLSQNDMVAVEGKLQINSFKLPNGNDKRVYEINANNIEKISASQNPMPQNQDANNDNIVSFEPDDTVAQDLIDEDEIPF